MSLQLLAENAIKHGVSKNKMGGKFHIFAYKRRRKFDFWRKKHEYFSYEQYRQE